MKTILPLVISLAALGAVAQTDKAPTDPVPPLAPAPPADLFAPVPTPPPAAAAAPARAVKAVKRATQNIAAAGGIMAQPVVPPPAPEKPNTATARKDRVITMHEELLQDLAGLPRSAKTGRTLVVQTSNPDATAIAETEEDLSVMALILLKATGSSKTDDKRMAMGIEVFGSSSGARNIYVEGYGALFLLGVRFPLIGPPDKVEDTKSKEEESSEWAEAREQFLRAERAPFEAQLFERAWSSYGKTGSEEYNADKVETLKNELLEMLKNATHIRALKPDEFVTVVIQGAEAVRFEKTGSRAGGGAKASSSRGSSRRGETVMTVRVKKSDVDSFAKGNLDLAGFRKKAAIQTYFRRGDSSVATSLFPTR